MHGCVCLSGAVCRVHSVFMVVGVALLDMPECLPLDVRYSMCTSVSQTSSTAWHCLVRSNYRKALGFARGSFWFL